MGTTTVIEPEATTPGAVGLGEIGGDRIRRRLAANAAGRPGFRRGGEGRCRSDRAVAGESDRPPRVRWYVRDGAAGADAAAAGPGCCRRRACCCTAPRAAWARSPAGSPVTW